MLFTGKIYVTENRKMYTQNISPIFSGGGNKKDLSETEKSFMVAFYAKLEPISSEARKLSPDACASKAGTRPARKTVP